MPRFGGMGAAFGGMGAGGRLPASAGAPASPTTVFTANLTSGDDIFAGYSVRQIAQLTGGAGTQVRVTLDASAALGGFQCNHVSIGIAVDPIVDPTSNTTATPSELLFSASSGVTVAQGAQGVSDWLTFGGFTASDLLIVIMDFAATGGIKYLGTGTNVARYKAASASWDQATIAAYSNQGGVICLSKIEVQ